MAQKSFLPLTDAIDAFARLGNELKSISPDDELVLQRAYHRNNWFTRPNVDAAIANIVAEFLDRDKLFAFAHKYELADRHSEPKKVALVFAGNIPLVGFHDWLCVLLAGHNAVVKLSSKDDVLFPWLLEKLHRIEPRLLQRTAIAEQLKSFDAVIATGSNNSARYFEHYFGKYPHIIRRNRSSVAIVDEQTTPGQLGALADDVFLFFGLGCRNVSKLFLHQGVDIDSVLTHFDKYAGALDHNKYRNNYDYRLTLLLMNSIPHHSNGVILAVDNQSTTSPLAMLHYERFTTRDELAQKLSACEADVQAIVGTDHIPFGYAQSPTLFDFADGVDVMKFLLPL